MSTAVRRKPLLAVCAIAVVLVAVAAAYVAYRERPVPVPPLRAGERVPPLTGRRLDQSPITIDYDDGTTPAVLYISTAWQMGPENERNVEALSHTEGFRFFRVLVPGAQVPRNVRDSATLTTVVSVPAEVQAAYRLDQTPQTIVIGAGGELLKSWTGAYDATLITALEDYFKVQLPGPMRDPYMCDDPWTGARYSAGAFAKIDGQQRRCRKDGNWETK